MPIKGSEMGLIDIRGLLTQTT